MLPDVTPTMPPMQGMRICDTLGGVVVFAGGGVSEETGSTEEMDVM